MDLCTHFIINDSDEDEGSEKEKTYKPRQQAVAEKPVTFIQLDENGWEWWWSHEWLLTYQAHGT